MRLADVALTLKALYPTRRPVYLHGPPGSGKSSVISQTAKALGVDFLDVRLLLHDPSDLKFPMVDLKKKEVHWVNSLFPRDPKWAGIIVLEELALCPPLLQGAVLQIALDRRCGEYTLPDRAWIVAASNRAEDRAGAQRLITPLLNRFIHLDVEVSAEDWQEWAAGAGIAAEVRAFLRFQPGKLFDFNPGSGERAFATPRSWQFASDVLPHTPREVLRSVIAGCVGEGAAAQFYGFLELYQDLPDLDELLKQPATYPIPAQPSVRFALTEALIDRVRADEKERWLEAAATYGARMPAEFGVLFFKEAGRARPKMMVTRGCQDFMKANRNLMLG